MERDDEDNRKCLNQRRGVDWHRRILASLVIVPQRDVRVDSPEHTDDQCRPFNPHNHAQQCTLTAKTYRVTKRSA